MREAEATERRARDQAIADTPNAQTRRHCHPDYQAFVDPKSSQQTVRAAAKRIVEHEISRRDYEDFRPCTGRMGALREVLRSLSDEDLNRESLESLVSTLVEVLIESLDDPKNGVELPHLFDTLKGIAKDYKGRVQEHMETLIAQRLSKRFNQSEASFSGQQVGDQGHQLLTDLLVSHAQSTATHQMSDNEQALYFDILRTSQFREPQNGKLKWEGLLALTIRKTLAKGSPALFQAVYNLMFAEGELGKLVAESLGRIDSDSVSLERMDMILEQLATDSVTNKHPLAQQVLRSIRSKLNTTDGLCTKRFAPSYKLRVNPPCVAQVNKFLVEHGVQ